MLKSKGLALPLKAITDFLSRFSLGVIHLSACLVVTFTAAAFFGRFDWLCDVLSSFRAQYVIALAAACLFAFHRPLLLSLFILALVVNLADIACLYLPGTGAEPAGARLKVMSMNLEAINNKKYASAVQCIESLDPDVISLQEVDQPFCDYLISHLPRYKYTKMLPDRLCAGVGIMSKFPIESSAVHHFGSNFPMLVCRVKSCLGPLNFMVAHPLPPYGGQFWHQQGLFAEGAGEICRTLKGTTILAGDFNATPWSFRFHQLQECARLTDSCQGFGLQPTWTTHCAALLIPIDHCLLSDNLVAVSRHICEDVASDHYPLYLEIARAAGGPRYNISSSSTLTLPHRRQWRTKGASPSHS